MAKGKKILSRISKIKLSWKLWLALWTIALLLPISLKLLLKPKQTEAWWNASWHYRQQIVIDKDNVSGSTTLQDFPLLISLTDVQITKAQTNGEDFVFTNGKVQIPHEIESYDDSTGELVAWVKVPELRTDIDTILYLYYGNQSASDQQNATDLWSDYQMTYHFNEASGTTGADSVSDSSGNTAGTPTTGITFDNTGKIATTADFSSGTGISLGTLGPALLTEDETISFWIKANPATPSRQNPFHHAYGGWGTMTLETSGTINYYLGSNGGSAAPYIGIGNSSTLGDGSSWSYVSLTRNGTTDTVTWYKNGSQTQSSSYSSSYPNIVDQTFTIGDGYANPINGLIDEFRVTSQVRSADWMATEYSNQNDPTSFISTGNEESHIEAIAVWSFDEGHGTTANDSVGSNDGTITGATWASEDQCVSGKCLEFNGGTAQISVADDSSLDQTGAMSISMWINPTTIDDNITLLNRSTITSDNGISFELHSGKPTLIINNGRVSGEVQMCDQTVTTNRFTHLTWSRDDSNNNHIYIDGIECTYSSTINQTQTSANTTLGLGSKLGKNNIALYPDYSDRTYEQAYTASAWNGDAGTIYYYGSGGVGDLAYKKESKTAAGTGGAYLDDNGDFTIENNHDYIISAWMKASATVSIASYAIDINRSSDNQYRTPGSYLDLTSSWQRFSWVYNAAADDYGTTYRSRHIIYHDDNLPMDFYWAGFQVEDVTGTGFTNPSTNFKGFIDEVKIYPYAVSADQINQELNKGSAVVLGAKDTGPLSEGLVGYWKMDEASWNGTTDEVIDYSGNGNHATSANGAAIDTGKYGNGGSFDGTDDSVTTTATSLFPYTNNFTISSWINPASLTNSRVAGHVSTSAGFGLGIRTTGEIWLVTQSVKDYITTAAPLETNQWQLITAVMDENNDVSFYLNGQFIEKVTHSAPASANTNTSFRIGQWNDTYKFNGSIDEVRVYNRALSANEVTDLYHYAPGPIGYWKMDEGSGTSTVLDSSGNGYNLTMNGSMTNDDWVTGKYGKALDFDNTDDRLSLASPPTFMNGSFTYSAWVNIDDMIDAQGLLNEGSPWTTDSTGFAFSYSAAGALFTRVNNGTGSYTDASTTVGDITGAWHHVSLVVNDDSTLTYYLDGVLVGSHSISAQAGSYDIGSLNIGSYTSSGLLMNGKMDEVKIYNYARTSQQVVEDMNAGHPAGGSPVGSQISYWKFDEGYGTTTNNSIEGGITGTFGGATNPAWNSGKINKALEFTATTGTDGSRVTYGSAWNPLGTTTGDEMTMSVWLKPDTSQTNTYAYFVRNGHGADNNFGTCLTGLSGGYYKVRVAYYDGSDFQSISTTSNIIPADTWSHLTLVWTQGTSIKIFVNGDLKETLSWVGGNSVLSTTTFNIGGHYGAAGQSYDGLIDEVKIYSSALTADQIKLDMNAGSGVVYGVSANEADDLSDGAGNDPVAEWNFDEKTGTTANDISGNGNTGTLTNSPSWTTGKTGSALSFSSSAYDYVEVTSESNFDFTSDFTINFWINASSSNGDSYLGLLGKYQSDQTGWDMGLQNGYVRTTIRGTSNIDASGSVNEDIRDDSWHHVSVVCTNSSIKTYIDGVLDGEATGTWTPVTNNASVFFGSRYAATTGFEGKLDHIKIYNYARTPSQIMYDYNRGKPVAQYKMDECQGSTIYDASGNGNDGTLTIGATGTQTTVGTCSTSGAWSNGASGKFSSAMSFDGTDDYFTIPEPAIQTSPNSFTVAGYIKPTNHSSRFITPQSTGIDQHINYNGTNQSIEVVIAETSDTNIRTRASTNNSVPHDTWTHFAVSIDDKDVKIYINGELDSQYTETIDISDWTLTWNIGQRGNSTFWYQGLMDDLQIYNYPLSENQVKKVMNEGSGVRFGN